jgi:hypothetical protein
MWDDVFSTFTQLVRPSITNMVFQSRRCCTLTFDGEEMSKSGVKIGTSLP